LKGGILKGGAGGLGGRVVIGRWSGAEGKNAPSVFQKAAKSGKSLGSLRAKKEGKAAAGGGGSEK